MPGLGRHRAWAPACPARHTLASESPQSSRPRGTETAAAGCARPAACGWLSAGIHFQTRWRTLAVPEHMLRGPGSRWDCCTSDGLPAASRAPAADSIGLPRLAQTAQLQSSAPAPSGRCPRQCTPDPFNHTKGQSKAGLACSSASRAPSSSPFFANSPARIWMHSARMVAFGRPERHTRQGSRMCSAKGAARLAGSSQPGPGLCLHPVCAFDSDDGG